MGKTKESRDIVVGFVGYRSQCEVIVTDVCARLEQSLCCFDAHSDSAHSRSPSVTILIVDQESFGDSPILHEWGQKLGALQPIVLVILGGEQTGEWLSSPLPSCVKQFIMLGSNPESLELAFIKILKAHSDFPFSEEEAE